MAIIYNSAEVYVTLNGVPVEGFATGDFVSIVRSADKHTKTVGADGEITIAYTTDRSGEATLTVTRGSTASATLDGFNRAADEGDLSGFSFDVVEQASGTLASSSRAWIKTEPALAFAETAGTEAWVLTIESLDIERKALPKSI